ncbi:hypothetical protein Nepgr_027683 [Nepenthes gracilis]|uniref:Uncharacterized protein n=1 Tax=Nepenthes gracilis TaxID=150966 RepID=A0AAD3TA97_NEPGR|nr:hypothetical protein Nepgr_027683 [Nepenthes gracilis]
MDLSILHDGFEDAIMDADDGKDEDDKMELELEGSDMDSMAEAGETGSAFKDKVSGVLKRYDYENKRSSKLSQNEFIHLLPVFNEACIHFA